MELRTVAAGRHRSFFVDATGALLVCGALDEGEVRLLGLRMGSSQTSFRAAVPTPVPVMAGVRIQAVVCQENCNLALSEAGQVFEWETEFLPLDEDIDSAELQVPGPAIKEELRSHRVRQVVTSGSHCAAPTEDGALFMWDTGRFYNSSNTIDYPIPQLGHGSSVVDIGVPHRVFAFEGMRIASVVVGAGFTQAHRGAGWYPCGGCRCG
jgi:alpha-tubulin suppressor-like RCC1 family protein